MSGNPNGSSHDEGRTSPPMGSVNIMSSLSFEAGLNVNQAVAMRELREENSRKNRNQSNLNNGSSSNSPTSSMDIDTLKSHYRAALAKKRELKRLLKRFDEDFQASHGGKLPKKADKEVMRPQYQQYHDSKASLDALKTQIERSLGYFPDELQGEVDTCAPSGGVG